MNWILSHIDVWMDRIVSRLFTATIDINNNAAANMFPLAVFFIILTFLQHPSWASACVCSWVCGLLGTMQI